MPPSGYTRIQSEHIAFFFKSIAGALKKEGLDQQLTPMQALEAECKNIQLILDEDNGQRHADQVLQLTLTFYQHLKQKQPENYTDFDESVEQVVQTAMIQIEAVHVPRIEAVY